MKIHRCETVHQFYVYSWIKDNFYLDHLALRNIDSNTILLHDGNDEAYIRYLNGDIILDYHSKISKYPFKKP